MVVKVDPRAENLDKLFLIYADIETESLRKLKILQIAAVTQDGDITMEEEWCRNHGAVTMEP